MNRDIRLKCLLIAVLPALFALSACAGSGPKQPAQRYLPISDAVEGWGPLQLSNRTLQLEALQGTMQLEYAGAMAEAAGEDLAGASVFKIKNADQFFKQNRDHDHFCAEPIRWVALNSKNGAPAWSSEIWLALLTIEDWNSYTPEVQGYCTGGKYVRDAP
jgi:hypothetical protein